MADSCVHPLASPDSECAHCGEYIARASAAVPPPTLTTAGTIKALTASIPYPTPANERPAILEEFIRLAIRLRANPDVISLLWAQLRHEVECVESAAIVRGEI